MFKLLGRVIPTDKNREVKPAVSLKIKETLLRISSITHTSVHEVAIEICESSVVSKKSLMKCPHIFSIPFGWIKPYIEEANLVHL